MSSQLSSLWPCIHDRLSREDIFYVVYSGPQKSQCYHLSGQSLLNDCHAITKGLYEYRNAPIAYTLFDQPKAFIPTFWACLRLGITVYPLPESKSPAAWRKLHKRIFGKFTYSDSLFLHDDSSLQPCRREDIRQYPHIKQLDVRALLANALGNDSTATDGISVRPANNKIAYILETSGTTGEPQAACFTGEAEPTPASEAVTLWLFPITSSSGIWPAFAREHLSVLIPLELAIRNPGLVVEAVAEHKISHISMPPVMVRSLLAFFQRDDSLSGTLPLASLRHVNVGSAPISTRELSDFYQHMTALGAPKQFLRTGYGLTETGPLAWGVFDSNLSSYQNDGSTPIGPLYDGVEVRYTENVLEVKKSFPFIGYLLPSTDSGSSCGGLNINKFRSGEEWFHTGDLARLKDGELVIQGRSKEIIIVNSRKVSLQEIEEKLTEKLSRPGETIIAGIIPVSLEEPNEKLVVAISTARNAANSYAVPEDICLGIRTQLSQEFGLSADLISYIDESSIPRTSTGKVRRKELMITLLSLCNDNKNRRNLPNREAKVEAREKLIALLGASSNIKPNIKGTDKVSQLGIDSLSLAAIIGSIEQEFALTCQLDCYPSDPTVQQLWRLFTAAAVSEQEPGQEDPRSALTHGLEILGANTRYSRTIHRNHIHKMNISSAGIPVGTDRTILMFNAEKEGMPLILLSNCQTKTLPRLEKELGNHPLYFLRTPNLPHRKVDREHLHHMHLEWVESVLPNCQMPFAISGICSGAFLAMELAKLLERRGYVPNLNIFIQWNPDWKHDSNHVLKGRSSYHIQKDHHLADPSTCKHINRKLRQVTPNIAHILFSTQSYSSAGLYPDGKTPHDALTLLIKKFLSNQAIP